MSLDTKVKNLIINTNMTKEQYEAVDDKSNQLFFVEDSSVVDVPAPEENQSGYLHTDGVNLTWKEIEVDNFLPLSGGTIDGELAIKSNGSSTVEPLLTLSYGSSDVVIKKVRYGKELDFDNTKISGLAGVVPTQSTGQLGASGAFWSKAYIRNLNAGAPNGKDLLVPSKAGTLATLEDIPEDTQLETLPTASADNLNKIYQYVGETTTDYTNGYFYKSTNDIVQDWFTTGYAQYDTSLTLIVTVDKEKFLAQNPVLQDMGAKTWRADYDESTGEWYVWTQQPQIYISNADLKDVWGIDITNAAGDYVPANGDTLMVQITESESFSWERVDVQPTPIIEDSMGSANAVVDTHDTSLDAHENIRGIANGLATLDNNAKVPMSQINDSLLGNVQYQGLYDVSTNTPNLDTVETKGHYYIVSVAGNRFDISFEVGDWIISDGTNWTKVDNTDAVSSVNGRTGNVVITTEDLDLSNYVQKTDIATVSTPGLVVASDRTKFVVFPNTGEVLCTSVQSINEASKLDQNAFISKGTLETLKYLYVKQGVVENTYTLTETEKQKVRNWMGATDEDIQKETMPSRATVGTIVQYIGETNKTYTNGYFYKYAFLGEGYTTNATSTITSFDFDQFWADVEAAGYTAESFGIDEKTKVGGGFRIAGIMTSETIMTLQQINGVTVNFTTTSMTFSRDIGQRLTFSYQTGKIYEWQQIDVQPVPEASGGTMVVPTPPTDNGTYVLKATVVDGVVTTEWVLEA